MNTTFKNSLLATSILIGLSLSIPHALADGVVPNDPPPPPPAPVIPPDTIMLPPNKSGVTAADLTGLVGVYSNKNTLALTMPAGTPGTANTLTLGDATATTQTDLKFATTNNRPALSFSDRLPASDSLLLQNLNISNVNRNDTTIGLSIAAAGDADGATGSIKLQNVNITARSTAWGAVDSNKAQAIVIAGKSINVEVKGGTIVGQLPARKPGNALTFTGQSAKSQVTFSGSTITGNIVDLRSQPTAEAEAALINTATDSNTVSLSGSSTLTGDVHSAHTTSGDNYLKLILSDSRWTGRSYENPDVQMSDSRWNVQGDSSVNSLDLAAVNTFNFGKQTNSLTVENTLNLAPQTRAIIMGNGLLDLSTATITGEDQLALSFSIPFTGSEPAVTAEGNIANGSDEDSTTMTFSVRAPAATLAKLNIIDSSTDSGIYQYRPKKTPTEDGFDVIYARSGLSNSAATVAALAAAPASIAAMESDALAKQINSLRHSKDTNASVWISYYGGNNKNSLKAGPQYHLKTNGVMLGIDAGLDDQGWKAGVALNTGKSTLSILNNHGDVTDYGGQLWMSWQYSNGLFLDGSMQVGHYSSTVKARMLDGTPARGSYATNGYGIGAKLGYAYQHAGFYAEPYIQATGRSFSNEAYRLSNNMSVNSNDYRSFIGEIGTDLGYTLVSGSGYFRPYLHLAVLNEFVSANQERINNLDVPNSINGTAFRVGIGGEVKLLRNLGSYASFDYTTGSDIARPWQINVGVSYNW